MWFLGRSQIRASRKGGGVAVIFKSTICVRHLSHPTVNSFKLIDSSLSLRPIVIHLFVVLRPLASSQSVFRYQLSFLLEQISLTNEKLLIVGDFKLSIRNKPDDAAQRFLENTEAFGFSQLVTSATDEGGSILDLVFTRSSVDLFRGTSVFGYFSNHRQVVVSLFCQAPRFPSMPISFRRLRDPEAFVHDIERLNLITNPSDILDYLVA